MLHIHQNILASMYSSQNCQRRETLPVINTMPFRYWFPLSSNYKHTVTSYIQFSVYPALKNVHTGTWVHPVSNTMSRVRLKCDGTRWRTQGEVKGKLANGVGSQYSSHYLGTWCIQHCYRWCAHLGCRSRLNWRPRRFKWTCPFRRKTKSGFCACAITFPTQSTGNKATAAWSWLFTPSGVTVKNESKYTYTPPNALISCLRSTLHSTCSLSLEQSNVE
jgi:hypothetical protein